MSAAPYTINDRRSSSGYSNANTLYAAAVPSTASPSFPPLDRDVTRLLSTMGWRQLVSGCRYLRGAFPMIGGGMDQMVTYAIGNGFNPQYYGRNKAWGSKAEAILYEADKVCNVRGYPFDFRTDLRLELLTMIGDGDSLCLLTGTNPGKDDDYPQFQNLPSTRVGSRLEVGSQIVADGPWKGNRMINGVISNPYGRPLAYRVYADNYTSSEYDDISANDLKMTYSPVFFEQGRGIPWIASAINDFLKVKAIREFLMIAIERESTIAAIETNETGMVPNQVLADLTNGPTSEEPGKVAMHTIAGTQDRYLKAGSGKLESYKSERPSPNLLEYIFDIERGGFEAMGWPIEFYDPSRLGGANIRMRVAQGKRRIEMLQGIAEKLAVLKRSYQVAKLIKLGVLEPDVDFWMFKHQKPKSITVDNGYDVKAQMELYLRGMITAEELCADQGEYWEDVQDQRIRERVRLEAECKRFDIDPETISQVATTTNQTLQSDAQEEAMDGGKQKEESGKQKDKT